LCRSLAIHSGGKTEFVCARSGWCQPGDNLIATLSSAGTPTQESLEHSSDEFELAKSDRWFKMIWLSNRDFAQLHTKAVFAASSNWPEPCIVVNGVSENEDMPWSLEEARNWLGYEPKDGIALRQHDSAHANNTIRLDRKHSVSPQEEQRTKHPTAHSES